MLSKLKWRILLGFLCLSSVAFTGAPREIPPHLYAEYTLGGQVPMSEYFWDDSYPPSQPLVFKIDEVNALIQKAKNHNTYYYGDTDAYLYAMLDKYSDSINGKSVAIVGSTTPWYESIVLAYGGRPTTIEYNVISSEDPRIKTMTVAEYAKNPIKFDCIVSISSIEHDGLGRYGDPLNPWGDREAIQKMKGMLNEGGLVFLSVPVGQDWLFWNAHRIYGRKRLALLLKTWEVIDSSGFSEADYNRVPGTEIQPVFVIKPKLAS